MTSGGGEECGEEGDYLAWGATQWILYGEAVMEEVRREEPCEEEQDFIIFPAVFTRMENCMQHCLNFAGRSPSVVTLRDWTKVKMF